MRHGDGSAPIAVIDICSGSPRLRGDEAANGSIHDIGHAIATIRIGERIDTAGAIAARRAGHAPAVLAILAP